MNAFQLLVYNQNQLQIYHSHVHQYHVHHQNLFYHLRKKKQINKYLMNNHQGEILVIHHSNYNNLSFA
jgi:hypothetical protein